AVRGARSGAPRACSLRTAASAAPPSWAAVTPDMTVGAPILELEQLSVGYTDEPVVVDFSAAIAAGTITTVIGPNGAGEATLLRAGYGLHPRLRGPPRLAGPPLEMLAPPPRPNPALRLLPPR